MPVRKETFLFCDFSEKLAVFLKDNEVGLWQSHPDKSGLQRSCHSTFGRSSQPDVTVHADKLYRAGKANQLLSIFEHFCIMLLEPVAVKVLESCERKSDMESCSLSLLD
jgi:hypothetical protein